MPMESTRSIGHSSLLNILNQTSVGRLRRVKRMKSKGLLADIGDKRLTAREAIRMIKDGKRLMIVCYPYDGNAENRSKAWEWVTKINDAFPNLDGFNFSSMCRYKRKQGGKYLTDLHVGSLAQGAIALRKCDAIFIAGEWHDSLECFMGCLVSQLCGIPAIELKAEIGDEPDSIEFREIRLPDEMPNA
jgi:hypothetical protein